VFGLSGVISTNSGSNQSYNVNCVSSRSSVIGIDAWRTHKMQGSEWKFVVVRTQLLCGGMEVLV
jgi:hypothetical protein